MRGPVAFAVALILALSFAPPVAADRDCGDFATQGAAQSYFNERGGSSYNNVDRLDADGDGIACELLPVGSLGPTAPLRPTITPRPPTPTPTPTPTPSRTVLTSTDEAASSGWGTDEAWLVALIFLGAVVLAYGSKGLDRLYSHAVEAKANPTPLSSQTIEGLGSLATLPPRPPGPPQPLSSPQMVTPTPSGPARKGYDTRTMPYREYLQTSEWHATRMQALRRANYRCQLCPRTDQLQVHHNTYERRGREAPGDLIVLCRRCHEVFHRQVGFPNR